jgi:hypothetical protein
MKNILVALLCCLILHELEATPIKCSKEPREIIKAHENYGSVQTYNQRLLPPGYEIDVYADDFRCEPHVSFTHPDGCNTCFCTDNGQTGGCTKMLCDESMVPVAASAQECLPGTSYKVECNTCYCGDNGVAVCTLLACLDAPEAISYFKREHTLCTIGDTTVMGGKTCKCVDVEVGHAWICDEDTKVETYSKKESCTPGTTFKMDCNTCVCGDNGLVVCTRMACIHEPIKQNSVDSCTPGSTFKVECNTCFCNDNGIAACTLMECIHETIPIEQSSAELCTPGTTFKLDCNTCVCGDNGMAACTRMECIHEQIPIKQNTADSCTPGSTFKVECNTCFCNDNGIAACTLMECPRVDNIDVYAPDFSCEPMQSFIHPDGCNKCKCSKAGKTLGCTKMICPSMKTYAAPIDEEDPVHKCTQGEILRGQCNL